MIVTNCDEDSISSVSADLTTSGRRCVGTTPVSEECSSWVSCSWQNIAMWGTCGRRNMLKHDIP